ARYHTDAVLNDGRRYGWVLETHPRWVNDGVIEGRFNDQIHVPQNGARLKVLVGFLHGATAGGARIKIYLESGSDEIILLQEVITYTQGVREFTVDFPASTLGNSYVIVLVVGAEGSSSQDWVAWARLQVTTRVGIVSTTTRTTTSVVTTTQTTATTSVTTATRTTTLPTTIIQTTTVATGATALVTTTRVETSATTVRETVASPTTLTTTQRETVINTVTQIQPTVILQTVTAQGGLTSRCLIATAAFGSELDPSVQMLRQFRDGFVLQTFSGRVFMDVFNAFYYSWSPWVAEAEYANPVFRTLVKYSIYPLLGVLHVSQAVASPLTSVNNELAVLAAGLTASLLIGLVYLSIPVLLISRLASLRMRVGARHVIQLLAGSLILFAAALALTHPLMMAFASSAVVLTALFLGAYIPTLASRPRRN
ncbi:MAG: CFI-box-CTERM domain-containing protein, partial [Candidatus Caldarchaeum sp.]|nr:CFI-box-CTERM domain-containing protein [Candidatus Caldarchaeum sp.]